MARALHHFTDKERVQLRSRLQAHKDRYGLSPQKLSDQIAERTGFPATYEGGRKRVDRFLKGAHTPPDDFLMAVADYLDQVAPIGIEESAMAIAGFLAQPHDRDADLSELVGRYQSYLRPMRPSLNPKLPQHTGMVPQQFVQPPSQSFDMAYAIFEMTPLEKSNGLLVAERIVNIGLDEGIAEFSETEIALRDSGVLVPFGNASFLILTRSLMETRLFRLTNFANDPIKLQGHLTLNSLNAMMKRRLDLQPFDPDFEVELVKMANTGDH